MNQRQFQSYQQQFRTTDQKSQQSLQPRFIPQQQNPYTKPQIDNRQQQPVLPKQIQQNPYSQQHVHQQQQQQSKGPLFLFSTESANKNQPIVSDLINKKQHKEQVQEIEIYNAEEEEEDNEDEDEQQDVVDNEEEEEEDNQKLNDENDEEAEDADDTEEENDDQSAANVPKITDVKLQNNDKFKSVNEITLIRQEVTKINKELDKLDQEIENTLVMSRVSFESQTILDMSVSQDLSYQQYLKEFEQFKQLKQSTSSSIMKQ